MTEVAALDHRITRLENQISAGLDRIEKLLRAEINDLKTEQINDLREANKRLADDQRRAWDAIENLRRKEDQRVGKGNAFGTISHFLSAGMGGLVAWLAAWLSSGKLH